MFSIIEFMFTHITNLFAKYQVMRRVAYKGEGKINHCLPIDAASVLGIICILGSILPAKSLGSDALNTSIGILAAMESGAEIKELVAVLDSGDKLVLECRSNGRFALADMKPMFKKLNINFGRSGKTISNYWVEGYKLF